MDKITYENFSQIFNLGLVSEVKDYLSQILEDIKLSNALNPLGKTYLLSMIYSFGALEEGQKEIGSLLFKSAKKETTGINDLDLIAEKLSVYLERPFGNKEYKLDLYKDKVKLFYDLKGYQIDYGYRSTYLDKTYDFSALDYDSGQYQIGNLNISLDEKYQGLKVEEANIIIGGDSMQRIAYIEILKDLIEQNPLFIRNMEIKKM